MFLKPAPENEEIVAAFAREQREDGYVGNNTRLWAWRWDAQNAFADARRVLVSQTTLSTRERAVLVCAVASSLSDAYCALAFGAELARESDPETAAAVLRAVEAERLTPRERALERWTRKVMANPNLTTAADVEMLRSAGLDEKEIFEATLFIAYRMAFSTVNDALGALPDRELADEAPAEVRAAVTYGRPAAER